MKAGKGNNFKQLLLFKVQSFSFSKKR